MFDVSSDGVFFEGSLICGWLIIERITSDEDGRFHVGLAFRDRAGQSRFISEGLSRAVHAKFVNELLGRGLRVFDSEKLNEYIKYMLNNDNIDIEVNVLTSDLGKVINAVREFILRNESGFHYSSVFTPSMRLGFRIKKEKHDFWAFTSDSLARVASSAGVSAGRTARLLNEAGYLFTNDKEHLCARVSTPLGRLRLYCVKNKILEGEIEPEFDDIEMLDNIAEMPETSITTEVVPVFDDKTMKECGLVPVLHATVPKLDTAETRILEGVVPVVPDNYENSQKEEIPGQGRLPSFSQSKNEFLDGGDLRLPKKAGVTTANSQSSSPSSKYIEGWQLDPNDKKTCIHVQHGKIIKSETFDSLPDARSYLKCCHSVHGAPRAA